MFKRVQKIREKGFTLIEMIVVIAIISALTAIVIASITTARQQSRDKERMSDLKRIEFALRLYYEKNGYYPAACDDASSNVGNATSSWVGDMVNSGDSFDCSTGANYIIGLAPDFIPQLPVDPYPKGSNTGYIYRVKKINGKAVDYKIMANGTVESLKITSYNSEFARCSKSHDTSACPSTPISTTYAVYTPGAENL